MCKRGDYWSTRYTKEERDEAREGLKRCVYQYLIDNDINDDFDKDITTMAILPVVPTTISSNFFYNDYGIKYFMTLNGLIPIKTAKNIVMSINNNAFAYGLTNGIEPGGIESSIIRRGDVGNKSNNNKVNIENLIVDINFLDCYFDNNG